MRTSHLRRRERLPDVDIGNASRAIQKISLAIVVSEITTVELSSTRELPSRPLVSRVKGGKKVPSLVRTFAMLESFGCVAIVQSTEDEYSVALCKTVSMMHQQVKFFVFRSRYSTAKLARDHREFSRTSLWRERCGTKMTTVDRWLRFFYALGYRRLVLSRLPSGPIPKKRHEERRRLAA
ncbi:MAG: hypothetical protein WC289_02020 [Patescibacteria group bacterium]